MGYFNMEYTEINAQGTWAVLKGNVARSSKFFL